jgi:hypothetical protein
LKLKAYAQFMETRLVIAYGLIALMAAVFLALGLRWRAKRRAKDKLRWK